MEPIPVILIFDIGKTNKKYFLINEQYQAIESGQVQLPETVDEDGFPCDDIALITGWMDKMIGELCALEKYKIRAINCSAYGASLVHIDVNGKALTPLYNYLKPYAEHLKEQFCTQYGESGVISLQTASPDLGSLNAGMQLYRLKHEQPHIYGRIAFSLHLPQYLSYSICGRVATEITSIGCHTRLWDFGKNTYHSWVKSECIEAKFAEIIDASIVKAVHTFNNIVAGPGLHDSSAALVPYLLQFKEPFVLLSTGTWNISLNPFNETPLTPGELSQDCLCYLSHTGKPVKASRLFAGFYHDREVDRIAKHFNEQPGFHTNLELAPSVQVLEKEDTDLQPIDPGQFRDSRNAYLDLINKIAHCQVRSTRLIVNGSTVKRLFVDGGFSQNDLFMRLLARLFRDLEVFAATLPFASATGAAMVIHNNWNWQPLPAGLITLKRYF